MVMPVTSPATRYCSHHWNMLSLYWCLDSGIDMKLWITRFQDRIHRRLTYKRVESLSIILMTSLSYILTNAFLWTYKQFMVVEASHLQNLVAIRQCWKGSVRQSMIIQGALEKRWIITHSWILTYVRMYELLHHQCTVHRDVIENMYFHVFEYQTNVSSRLSMSILLVYMKPPIVSILNIYNDIFQYWDFLCFTTSP